MWNTDNYYLGSMQSRLQMKSESVGSSNPESTEGSHNNEYSHLYDQFNVKPKTMLVRRYKCSDDGQKHEAMLKSLDLD